MGRSVLLGLAGMTLAALVLWGCSIGARPEATVSIMPQPSPTAELASTDTRATPKAIYLLPSPTPSAVATARSTTAPVTPVSPTPTPTPRPTPSPTSGPTPTPAPASPAIRIVIPSVGVDAKVVEVGWEVVSEKDTKRAVWETANYAAGHHLNSAHPGQRGNVVISGHNNTKGEVFRDLWKVKAGDEIFLYSAEGQRFRYVVREALLILYDELPREKQEEIARPFLDPNAPEARLTLISCWPYREITHRVIVIGKLEG